MSTIPVRWLRRLAVVAGAAVALVLLLHLLLYRLLPLDDLVETWSPVMGVPLEVESARARILPYPSVRLEGVAYRGGVTLDRVDVVLRIPALLRGNFEGGRARVRGARLALVRRTDGSLQLGGAAEETGTVPGATEEPSQPSAVLPALPQIELRDVVIHYEDQTAQGGARSTDVYVDAAQAATHADSDSLDLVASGRLDGQGGAPTFHVTTRVGAPGESGKRPVSVDIRTHGIDPALVVPHVPGKWGIRSAEGSLDAQVSLAWGEVFDGRLDLHFAPGRVDYAGVGLAGEISFQAKLHDAGPFELSEGRVQAAEATLGSVEARNLRGRLSYTQRVVTLESVEFEAWGGSVTGQGTVEASDPLGFALELTAGDLSLYRLEHPRGGDPPDDPIRMNVDGKLHGHWTGGEDWLEQIQGTADLSMRGGQVFSGDLLRSMISSVAGQFPEHADANAHQPLDTTPLEEFSAPFAIHSGRAHTDDLVVVTQDYRITGQGSVGSQGDYALEGALVLTPEGLSRLLAAASIRGRQDPRAGLPKSPFHISGSLSDGSYRVHLDEQPLTALVILPVAMDGLAETVTAPVDAVGNAVDWFEGRGDPEPDAASD